MWRQTIGDADPLRPNALGARGNPPGEDALYCSLTAVGASLELASMIARQSVEIRKALQTYRLTVSLSRVADLRQPDDLAPFGYSLDVLVADDWNAPQKVGGAAAWLGFAGILVPSARHPDGNLVVYINHLAPNDAVELVQREDEDGR